MNDYGLSVRQLAKAIGVTERTVRRWKKIGEIPEPYRSALRVGLADNSGIASPAWTGWRFRDDRLICPEGVVYHQNDIRASPLWRSVIEAQRAEIAQRRADSDLERELRHKLSDILSALTTVINAAQHLQTTLSATPAMQTDRHSTTQTQRTMDSPRRRRSSCVSGADESAQFWRPSAVGSSHPDGKVSK